MESGNLLMYLDASFRSIIFNRSVFLLFMNYFTPQSALMLYLHSTKSGHGI